MFNKEDRNMWQTGTGLRRRCMWQSTRDPSMQHAAVSTSSVEETERNKTGLNKYISPFGCIVVCVFFFLWFNKCDAEIKGEKGSSTAPIWNTYFSNCSWTNAHKKTLLQTRQSPCVATKKTTTHIYIPGCCINTVCDWLNPDSWYLEEHLFLLFPTTPGCSL